MADIPIHDKLGNVLLRYEAKDAADGLAGAMLEGADLSGAQLSSAKPESLVVPAVILQALCTCRHSLRSRLG